MGQTADALAHRSQPLSSLTDLSPYSHILAVDVESPAELLALSDAAWDKAIPLIKVESAGFYASLRTQVKEVTGASLASPSLSSTLRIPSQTDTDRVAR